MRLLDRIALNRLIIIIGHLVLSLMKLFEKTTEEETPKPSKPKRKKILPWRNK
jgi:hypothetical protein